MAGLGGQGVEWWWRGGGRLVSGHTGGGERLDKGCWPENIKKDS